MRPNLYAIHKSIPPVHVLSQTNSCNLNAGNHRLQLSVKGESKSVIAGTRYNGTGSGSLANCYNIAGQLQHKKTVSLTGDSQTLDPIPNTTIRFATTNDTQAIASLLLDSFVEYESLYTPEGFAATAIASEPIVARMREGPVWVAVRDEKIMGTVSVVAKADSLYIRGMAVLPAARGERIGASMLTHIEEFARTNGFSRLFLSTTPFLSRAIRLYERFGFRRTSEGPHELFGTPLFTMEKPSRFE
jgi:N-acetylglutamate synthase-like GNAT family acetyltransferase